MVNSREFIGRLEKILDHYALSASAFADQIGVQRSSISHLLSGRNKPSLEFVLKVIRAFPEVNLYWFLNGKGSFPAPAGEQKALPRPGSPGTEEGHLSAQKEIDKVILFYTDGSFETYHPSGE